jgi:hypothetical protein
VAARVAGGAIGTAAPGPSLRQRAFFIARGDVEVSAACRPPRGVGGGDGGEVTGAEGGELATRSAMIMRIE